MAHGRVHNNIPESPESRERIEPPNELPMKKIPIQNFLKMTPSVPQYSDKNQNYLIAGANPISYLEDGTQEEQAAPLAASIDWAQISAGAVGQGVNIYAGAGALQKSGFYAQSFVGAGQTLGTVKVPMEKTGNPNDNYYAYVYASTGSAGSYKPTRAYWAISDPYLAISDPMSASSLTTTSYVLTSITFSGANAITLTAGTTYILVVCYHPYGDFSNYITVGTTTGLLGNASWSADGTTWTVDSTQDMIFYLNSPILATVIEGNVIHMVSSTEGTYSAYIITDTTHVYGIKTSGGIPTAIDSFGYPANGGAVTDLTGYLAIGGGDGTNKGGFLFATYATSGHIYKSTLPTPSAPWTDANSQLQTGVNHTMEQFLQYIMVKDATISNMAGNLIRKLDPTSTAVLLTGLDVGAGFSVLSLRNFNDKYLAIAVGKTSGNFTGVGFTSNYIFFWDGISSRYNYSVRVPGQFIDMKVIDSVLYVVVMASNGKTCVYSLVNTSLRKAFTVQFSNVKTPRIYSYNPCPLFNFRNYIGLNLDSNSDLTYPLLVHGQEDSGQLEFVHSSGRLFDQMVVGYDGLLFGSVYVVSGNSVLYFLPTKATIVGNINFTAYQNLLYKSQWIPVKNLQAIDVYYDTPPTGADSINVTIDGRGEDIISGTSTTTLTSITASTILNTSRTRLDLKGFTGDKVRVTLSTNFTNTRPVIRAIVLITA